MSFTAAAFDLSVRYLNVQPSEFYNMSPQEFWVLFEGKEKEHNKTHQMPDDKKERLKKLYFDAKAKEESKKALQEFKRKKALENG